MLSRWIDATANAGSVERDVYRSAGALTLGLGLLLGGAVVLLLGSAFGPMVGPSASWLLVILGIVTIVAGTIQFVIGVYRCADNIDRAAKALIDGQRG